MNVWDVIAKGANRFFENIASELEYVQHFATVASVFPRIPTDNTANKKDPCQSVLSVGM